MSQDDARRPLSPEELAAETGAALPDKEVISLLDLNADLGETVDGVPTADDEAMFEVISSASVACGGHAGDVDAMLVSATGLDLGTFAALGALNGLVPTVAVVTAQPSGTVSSTSTGAARRCVG